MGAGVAGTLPYKLLGTGMEILTFNPRPVPGIYIDPGPDPKLNVDPRPDPKLYTLYQSPK